MRVFTIILLTGLLASTVCAQQGDGTFVDTLAVENCGPSCDKPCCQQAWLPEPCSWFVNTELLMARPHFSEAVAYARGVWSPTTIDVQGQKIGFDYEPGLRLSLGRVLSSACESWQMQYTYLHGAEFIDGSVTGPTEFIVDPFGNVVGAALVTDPSDPRVNTVINGGDLIRTWSSVQAHVYDLGYTRTWRGSRGAIHFDAGARIADIDQSYTSQVTLGGAPLANGSFTAEFTGVGPRLGVRGSRRLRCQDRLTVNASAHTSWLVGNHDVSFSNSVPVLPFAGSQRNVQARTVPVLETEISVDWRIRQGVTLATGWLFHAWHDLGVSGGTFGGFFTGSDDGNIMAFDGLVLRLEMRR